MIISYHILLGLPLYTSGLSAGLYCGSDTPLDTPYFSPFYKTLREATGCTRAVTDSEDQEVHVVRLDQPAENVFLYVTGKASLSSAGQSTDCNTHKGSTNNNNSLALVLASPTPVTWHLTTSGFNSHTDILISDGSRVLDIETGDLKFLRTSGGITALQVHPKEPLFAVAERGTPPVLSIFSWPSLEVITTIK